MLYCGCAELGMSSPWQDISIVAASDDAVGGEGLEVLPSNSSTIPGS